MSDLSEKLAAIPEAAVEAAARELSPAAWGPRGWTFGAPGDRNAASRERSQQESLARARAALEAANLPLLALVREQAAKLAVVDEALERALKFHKEIESYGGYCTGCARVGPCEVRVAITGGGQ